MWWMRPLLKRCDCHSFMTMCECHSFMIMCDSHPFMMCDFHPFVIMCNFHLFMIKCECNSFMTMCDCHPFMIMCDFHSVMSMYDGHSFMTPCDCHSFMIMYDSLLMECTFHNLFIIREPAHIIMILAWARALPQTLFRQHFLLSRLELSFNKLYGHHHDFHDCYKSSVTFMMTDSSIN